MRDQRPRPGELQGPVRLHLVGGEAHIHRAAVEHHVPVELHAGEVGQPDWAQGQKGDHQAVPVPKRPGARIALARRLGHQAQATVDEAVRFDQPRRLIAHRHRLRFQSRRRAAQPTDVGARHHNAECLVQAGDRRCHRGRGEMTTQVGEIDAHPLAVEPGIRPHGRIEPALVGQPRQPVAVAQHGVVGRHGAPVGGQTGIVQRVVAGPGGGPGTKGSGARGSRLRPAISAPPGRADPARAARASPRPTRRSGGGGRHAPRRRSG